MGGNSKVLEWGSSVAQGGGWSPGLVLGVESFLKTGLGFMRGING